MNLIKLLAQTGAPTAPASQPAPEWLKFLVNWGPILLIVLFFWVFVGGSKRKQENARKALLDNLKKGDKIRLIGGEYGTVYDVQGTKVVVKVDESSNTKITYSRDAVQAVEKE